MATYCCMLVIDSLRSSEPCADMSVRLLELWMSIKDRDSDEV